MAATITGPLIPLEAGETAVWTGEPGLAAMQRRARYSALKGAVFGMAVVLGLLLVYRSGLSAAVKMAAALVAAPGLFVAVLMVLLPRFVPRVHAGTHYALTDRRLFVTAPRGQSGWVWLRDVTAVEVLPEPDGTGTVKVLAAGELKLLQGLPDAARVAALIRPRRP